jgi:hypothetical protein
MANENVRGGTGNCWYRGESALGTGSGTWKSLYLEETPEFPTSTRMLAENSPKGFQNPHEREKPIPYEIYRENAFRLKQRFRCAETAGQAPAIGALFQSAGWTQSVGGATAVSSATVGAIGVDSATGMAAGKVVLVELDSGVYYPMLINSVATLDLIPQIDLPSAPSADNVVELMYSWTPTSSLGFQIPTDKTLQFRYNSLGYDDDAVGDLSFIYTGCAVGELAAIELGKVGTIPQLDFGIHVCTVDKTPNDIADDDFQDGVNFAVMNGDFEMAFATAETDGSLITPLVTKYVDSITVTPGITTVVQSAQGSGGVNNAQGFLLQQTPPQVSFTAYWRGDDAFENNIWTQLESLSASDFYWHAVQPTRSLSHPAFSIHMPKCHLLAGSEPSIMFDSDGWIKCTITLEATVGGIGGEKTISEIASAPIVIASSGQSA